MEKKTINVNVHGAQRKIRKRVLDLEIKDTVNRLYDNNTSTI